MAHIWKNVPCDKKVVWRRQASTTPLAIRMLFSKTHLVFSTRWKLNSEFPEIFKLGSQEIRKFDLVQNTSLIQAPSTTGNLSFLKSEHLFLLCKRTIWNTSWLSLKHEKCQKQPTKLVRCNSYTWRFIKFFCVLVSTSGINAYFSCPLIDPLSQGSF